MQSAVERIVCADAPLTVLQEELRRRDVYDGTTLLQSVLGVVIRNRRPTPLLRELLEFNHERDRKTGHYAQWYATAIAYGDGGALSLVYEETRSLDKMVLACRILTEAARFGRERILKVLDFLNEKEDLRALLNHYMELINSFGESLAEEQKLLLLTVIEYLSIDVDRYDWGAEDSIVRRWIFSLRD